ncbi:MAG: DUF3987 domain-containing protein [Acidobacteria bacterium]|nr:DUF3987 domain-containing protein [Acidobacteriota bacterium]
MARCPAHDDKSPSLSITEKDDKVLVHCFAGCTPDEILSAVGLEFRDLFLNDEPFRTVQTRPRAANKHVSVDAIEDQINFVESSPRPLDQTLKPVPILEDDYLPKVLVKWLRPASKLIGCPFDFLVLSAIVFAGSLIGSRVRIRPQNTNPWFVVPNLYAAVVGLPSTKKSPALDETRKPILQLQSIAKAAYDELKAEYEIDLKFYEKKEKETLNGADTKSAYKDAIASLERPERPTMRRYETNDCTTPKLIQFLLENPNGFVQTRDELMGFLRALEAEYDRSARQLILELAKGAITYDMNRVSENREIYLTSGTLSIIGGVQPAKLQRYIAECYSNDDADGFLQRFIFAYPDTPRQTSKATPSDRERMQLGFEAANRLLAALASNDFGGVNISDSGQKFRAIRFNTEAQAIFDEWKEEIELEAERLQVEDAPFAAYLYKMEKSCSAIALIFHMLESEGPAISDEISSETLLRTLAYVEVLTMHARRVFALGENQIYDLARVVLGKIKKGDLKSGFTAYDVKRKGWSGLKTNDTVNDVLHLLVDYGYLLQLDTKEKPGRPTAKYLIHSSLESGVNL